MTDKKKTDEIRIMCPYFEQCHKNHPEKTTNAGDKPISKKDQNIYINIGTYACCYGKCAITEQLNLLEQIAQGLKK